MTDMALDSARVGRITLNLRVKIIDCFVRSMLLRKGSMQIFERKHRLRLGYEFLACDQTGRIGVVDRGTDSVEAVAGTLFAGFLLMLIHSKRATSFDGNAPCRCASDRLAPMRIE